MKIRFLHISKLYFIYFTELLFVTSAVSQTLTVDGQKKSAKAESLMIYSDKYQKEFELIHYWDNIDIKDTDNQYNLSNKTFIEYLYLLDQVPQNIAIISLKKMVKLNSSDKSALKNLLIFSEKLFFDPNSMFKNEEYYKSILEDAVSSGNITIDEKRYYANQLILMNKNRTGTFANDFNFTLTNGTELNLYSIQSEYTILLFSNPECNACNTTINQISHSETILKLLKTKNNNLPLLQIVNIYTDKGFIVWYNYEHTFPKLWMNGYDKNSEINNKCLYDLKAMPTLYLLDKEKKVILKDTPFYDIEKWLSFI